MTPKPFHYVTLTSDTGLKVRVLLDSNSAHLTGGFGGWEVVARPKRVGIVRFAGRDPFRMEVPVLFDGYGMGKGQEADISTLIRMSQPPTELKQPPTIKISGAVPRTDLTWVIEDLVQDNQSVIWDQQGGVSVRLRQGFVVHLLQYVDDTLITTAASPTIIAGGGTSGSKVKVGSGKTAKQEAQTEYGSASLFTILFAANPWMTPDPRAPIPTGTEFVVPPKSAPTIAPPVRAGQ